VCQPLGPGFLSCTSRDHGGVLPALVFFIVALWIAGILLAIYATRDMDRRGQSGCLWGALVLFGGCIGNLFWLIQRWRYPVVGE